MAKTEIRNGAQIDTLNAEEAKVLLRGHLQGVTGWFEEREGTVRVVTAEPITTDNTGKGSGNVYHVAQGFRCYLLRLAVDFFGSSAASPVTCDVRISADEVNPASTVSINNSLPSVFTESKSHAPLFQPGQRIVVSTISGPTSTQLFCRLQVLLVPVGKVNLPDSLLSPPAYRAPLAPIPS